ncbi:DUF4181 domain-containing protein [Oceanobacillus jordanicus]|uniref:DUF4181 domain-containing protein n=1 Tax=Oceanobacillus jordanicus TaxID=2867266 RepID=A0AAW5B5C1_9BACI|nr:DUF4181 domain-containing protein [Oceanobacillus jordanicus]
MYGEFDYVEFLMKILLLTAIVTVLQVLLRNYLNKLFHIKKKFFSYDHVNKIHQKFDWLIRIASVFIIVYFIYQDDLKETIYAILSLAVIQESVKAFMEWKYIKSRKFHYITLIELGGFILFAILLLLTNGFGLFNI